jgi:hypothetical protein
MGAFLDEFMDARVNDLDGKDLGQLSKGSGGGAAYAGGGALGSGDLDAQGLA